MNVTLKHEYPALTFRGNVQASSSRRVLARFESLAGSRGTIGIGSPARSAARLWFSISKQKHPHTGQRGRKWCVKTNGLTGFGCRGVSAHSSPV